MRSSPFTTSVRHYTYYAASPFEVGERRRVYLRLRPVFPHHENGGRREANMGISLSENKLSPFADVQSPDPR